jgi:hypothetical protein
MYNTACHMFLTPRQIDAFSALWAALTDIYLQGWVYAEARGGPTTSRHAHMAAGGGPRRPTAASLVVGITCSSLLWIEQTTKFSAPPPLFC